MPLRKVAYTTTTTTTATTTITTTTTTNNNNNNNTLNIHKLRFCRFCHLRCVDKAIKKF